MALMQTILIIFYSGWKGIISGVMAIEKVLPPYNWLPLLKKRLLPFCHENLMSKIGLKGSAA